MPPEPVVAKLAPYTLPVALILFTELILLAVTVPVTFNALVTLPLKLKLLPLSALLLTTLPNAETSVNATTLPAVAVPVTLIFPVKFTPLL